MSLTILYRKSMKLELPAKKYYVEYRRKSSEGDERQIQSLNDQAKANNELAKRLGLVILKVFEESKSAKQPLRFEFNQMLSLIHERQDIKGILAWHFNRLSRNPIDTAALQWLLQQGIIEEIVTTQRTYKSEDSALLMALEGGMANQYILDLKKAAMRGVHSKVEQGHAPQFAPTGYLNDKTKPQGARDIIPNPEQFPILQRLFQLFLTGNYSVEGLVRKSEETGLRNNRNKRVSKSQMYKILRNPFYTGRFVYEGEIHQGKHDRMLSDEEFELIQHILEGKNKSRPQKPLEFTLNGFVRCKSCSMAIVGERYIKTYKNGKTQEFRYYRCTKKNKFTHCTELYVQADKLEGQVLDFLNCLDISPKFIEWAKKWCLYLNELERERQEPEREGLQRHYTEVVKKIQGLVDLQISPDNKDGSLLSELDYKTKRKELVNERDNFAKAIKKLNKRTDEWDDMVIKTFNFAQRARERFATGGFETKKLIVKGIGSHLTLGGRELDIMPRKVFRKIKNRVETIKSQSIRLEPNERVVFMANTEDSNSSNILWRARRDSNSQPSA